MVNKHGMTWFVSAGNDGPALCTVGSPPDICTNVLIAVGAYVSPEMMTAMFSNREKLPGQAAVTVPVLRIRMYIFRIGSGSKILLPRVRILLRRLQKNGLQKNVKFKITLSSNRIKRKQTFTSIFNKSSGTFLCCFYKLIH